MHCWLAIRSVYRSVVELFFYAVKSIQYESKKNTKDKKQKKNKKDMVWHCPGKLYNLYINIEKNRVHGMTRLPCFACQLL